jgi:hypothetical protein
VKHLRTIVSFLALAMFLAACADTPTQLPLGPDGRVILPDAAEPGNAILSSEPGENLCEQASAVRLLAAQTQEAGSVQVWSTADHLYVRFATGPGWSIGQTHVAVAASLAGIPMNGQGNPVPGQFAFSQAHAPTVTEFTHVIELSVLGVETGDELFVAVHAEVEHKDGERESAWGEGARFVNRGNWATYFMHTVADCDDDGPGQDPPPPGRDVVVFNDIDLFSVGWDDENNRRMTENLISFSGSGPRADGSVIWTDRGRNSACFLGGGDWCGTYIPGFRPFMEGLGFTVQDFTDANPAPITSIPANVKVIFLLMPRIQYSIQEINAFKAFAEEGGRVVFIGEHQGFYGLAGIAVENQFLANMGAVLRNTGGEIDCEPTVIPGTSLRSHQVTTGMEQVTVACASEIDPGPNDYPLFYDTTGTRLLGGVAVIDTTPIAALSVVESELPVMTFFGGDLPTPSGR